MAGGMNENNIKELIGEDLGPVDDEDYEAGASLLGVSDLSSPDPKIMRGMVNIVLTLPLRIVVTERI
jgi:hypothetical protein